MITRTASLKDLQQLTVLFDAYRQFYQQDENLSGCQAFLSERISQNQSHIIVAEKDNRLLGFTQLYPSYSSVSMQQAYILNDLFVDQSQRTFGAGTALLDAAVAFGKQQKAAYLVLETEADNLTAQSLYENKNWQKDINHFHYNYKL